ncbi:uncharacterized protein Z518_00759 [Rhinocladiella mackenziei CBS 650.93]|uniref:Xylanolytic transcriptional activator regulatory domain-containing protein n=1 Tax=Rhinocladiella mackenziei CBS 650.93 TaxID=1442369 RepID=A0A0D2HG82_9EURO|nr:uncharacterized protein Z518_00759 [Rhinocladiella mackenziei CBS 650.93]KIX09678.1 hypothetical protein Z518_00759 [Rhinocladiella mackenziei CBS 650.93]
MSVECEKFVAMGDGHVSHAKLSNGVGARRSLFYLNIYPSIDCNYKSTRGQRIAGAPRTKILEDRLRRARALISKLQAQNPSAQLNHEVNSIFDSPPGSPSSAQSPPGPTDDSSGDHLENMMDGMGRLTSTPTSTEYYGGGSGFAFLQQTQQWFNRDSIGRERPASHQLPADVMSRLFDSPLPDKQALEIDVHFSQLLPSRQTATELLHVVFGRAYQLLQFLHEPTFRKQTDRIYDLDPMDLEDSDHEFLPLFYSVTALGYLFHQKTHDKYGCKGAVNQAMRHFTAARRMVNLDQCRDVRTLQTLLCFVLFLMSTARLATAHTLVGLAVAASMKIGLHSQTSCDGLSQLEKDIRRRVFWTIVKLDMYSGTVLGLPGMINLDYVDQLKPSGLTQDYASEHQGRFVSLSARRMFAASAQHLEVLMIIGKVVRKLHPKTDEEAHQVGPAKKIYVGNATIAEIEDDFKSWRNGLVDALGSPEHDDSLSSVVYELEMVHNFGHILLYRPFLHYLAKTESDHPPDPRLLRCATSCVRISRLTISRSDEMLRRGFLTPAAWQSIYTVFLSLVTLTFFLATQRGNKEYEAIQKETELGIQILATTSCQDIGSRRCLDVLRVLTRLSHITDLDVDRISEGAPSLCKSFRHHGEGRRNSAKGSARGNAGAQLPTPDRHDRHAPTKTAPKPTSQRQFVHRPQPRAQPTSQQMPQMPVHLSNMSMYQSPSMLYPAHVSIWEQSMSVPNAELNQYMGRPPFPYAASHPGSETKSNESFGRQSDMEMPYTEGFAWPFEMVAESGGERQVGGTAGITTSSGPSSTDTAGYCGIHANQTRR